jgi:NhaP-type Na+/H+ or K+/H+ antiporter
MVSRTIVAAIIVEALRLRHNLEKQEVNEEQAEIKKMDAAA